MLESSDVKTAVEAAVQIGETLGLSKVVPRVLRHSNHTIVHLMPHPVVARVRANIQDARNHARLTRELEMCLYLAEAGAPVVPPARNLATGPHYHRDAGLTLWEFIEHRPAAETDWPVAISAYKDVHRAMIDYAGPLPFFLEAITECSTLLAKSGSLPELRGAEREFLSDTYDQLMAALSEIPFPTSPIHGDPHLGNVLISKNGPLWTDFESVCLGPKEWALTCHPVSCVQHCQVDLKLLDVLRRLRSLCVVVWCSMSTDRPLEKQEAATLHLKRLQAHP